MIFIIISSLLSLGLIWANNALARSKYWGMAGACMLAAGAAILPGFIFRLFFPAVALQSALTLVCLLVCIVFRRTPKTVLPLSIAATVASYGFFLWTGFGDLITLSKPRAKNPLVSVADRLAYEAKATEKVAQIEAPSQMSVFDSQVEKRLVAFEDRRSRSDQPWRHNRRTMLAALHTRKRNDFEFALGFGRIRMPPAFDSEREVDLSNALADDDNLTPPPKREMFSLHEPGMIDFLDPDRIGYVNDWDHVAGFQSHRFAMMPEVAVPEDQFRESLQIVRLELISLLKHDVPVAYVSKKFHQMDELWEAPVRPLEDFERQSLDSLRADEDVMIDETSGRIRMVGSLRAGKTCLRCHSARHGDLLGALTYEIVPDARRDRKRLRSARQIRDLEYTVNRTNSW